MIKSALLLLLLSIIPLSGSASLPQSLNVPGGVAIIKIGDLDQPMPKVFYQQKRVLVSRNEQDWIAIIGIPLSTKPGPQQIVVKDNHHTRNIPFQVSAKDYPAQYLTIKKKRMVSGFTDEDLKKINADKVEMTAAKSVWTEKSADTNFILPAQGRISSLFGLKRFYNDIPKKPHNGLDIAAKTGAPIIAPNAGTVIKTGHYYFNGKTVFLDHGQGLLSAYLHMNEIKVKEGETVQQGQILGTIGTSGRVTGAHLHWMIFLNNTPVDPALFVNEQIHITQ